jgi:hypothetical protein
MQYRLRTLLILLAVAPPLVAYTGSYYFLSRRGYSYADAAGIKNAFFFAPPESDRDGKTHGRYFRMYFPLIVLDQYLRTGRSPYQGTRGLSE